MGIEKTDAIVLQKQDLRESSLIVTFYTRDFGKIKGVIRGARGPKAELGTNPQPFSLNRIVFYERKRGDLEGISQLELADFFPAIRKDLIKTAYACYIIELLDALTPLGDKNEEIFELLVNSLKLLVTPASAKRTARLFEIKLLGLLGYELQLELCAGCGGKIDKAKTNFGPSKFGVLCAECAKGAKDSLAISAGTINFIKHVAQSPYEKASRIKVSETVGKELEQIMRRSIDYELGRQLKTQIFLEKIEGRIR